MRLVGMIKPTPPYNFAKMLAVLARFHPVMDIVREGDYWRALHVGEQVALVRVRSQGTVDTPLLEVHLAAGEADSALLLQKLRHILSADEDLTPFYARAMSDAALWETVAPLRGLRLIRAASVFEALIITIIEQQIALTAAQRAERWLVEWAGNAISYQNESYYAFPTRQQIAAAEVADLIPLKITFTRMQLLIDLARGELDLESLRTVGAAMAYERLLGLRGVGHWTAAWTLTRGLSGHYAVGDNDVALQAAANRYFYGQTGRTTSEVVSATFARYGEYAGLAAFYTLMRWVLDRYSPPSANLSTTEPSAPPPE